MMHAMRTAFGLVLILVFAAPAAAQPREPLAKNCHTPEAVSDATVPLPHTARMLRRDGAVRIVARAAAVRPRRGPRSCRPASPSACRR
jgi:hypothetical protein